MAASHRNITEDELRARLSDELQSLGRAGLSEDEAFLIAAKRLAATDAEVRALAREHFAGLWDDPEPVPEDSTATAVPPEAVIEPANRSDEGAPTTDELARGRRGFWIMAAFAGVAGVAVRLPEAFGIGLTDSDDSIFYARNIGLFVLAALAGWFVWARRPHKWCVVAMGAVFAASAAIVNAYPFDEGGSTDILAIAHLPALLWLVVGVAHTGGDWRSSARRMDYVRFTGEWVVYYVLIALGGAVFSALTVGVFVALDVDTGWMTEWVMVAGSAAAVVVTAWLVEFWAGAVPKIASMLAQVFTPLFAAMLLIFLVAVAASGRSIENDRDVLILFNVLLGLVVGLLLFSAAARPADSRPGVFDLASAVLATAGLVTSVLTLVAIVGRIADFGWSPNRTAIAGMNLILLVNLAGSVWLYFRLWRRHGPFANIVRWQTAHFGIYAAWAAVVVVAFPPIFGFA